MSAAKILRNGAGRALSTGDNDLGNAALVGADALEALAVPGVADLLEMVAAGHADLIDNDTIDDAQRSALATLARIGRGE